MNENPEQNCSFLNNSEPSTEFVFQSKLAGETEPLRQKIREKKPTISKYSEISPPTFLFLQLTTECPLHCQMCKMGRLCKDPDDKLSEKDYVNAINEFAGFPTDKSSKLVVFTGGEPFLKKDLIFQLSSLAQNLGILTAVNTNGTQILSEDYERLLTAGPSHILFSLDSTDPLVNDKIRNRKGFWKSQVQLIKNLTSLKRELIEEKGIKCNNKSIAVNTIIGKFNYYILPEISKFVINELKGDGIIFQPLAPTFQNNSEDDPFFEENSILDIEILENSINELITQKKDGMPINMENFEIRWIKNYFENPNRLIRNVCDSFNRNLMISVQGHVSLCSNHYEILGDVLGKFPKTSLYELWTGPKAAISRKKMEKCTRNCGMMNCHRKLAKIE